LGELSEDLLGFTGSGASANRCFVCFVTDSPVFLPRCLIDGAANAGEWERFLNNFCLINVVIKYLIKNNLA